MRTHAFTLNSLRALISLLPRVFFHFFLFLNSFLHFFFAPNARTGKKFSYMLNRRPSRIEVKPEDRQEEVRELMMMISTMMLMMRTTIRTFARSSRSRAFIRSLLSLSLSFHFESLFSFRSSRSLSVLSSLSLIEQQQYDELRKAHVEQLKQQIALQGSSLDDEDNIDVHHLLLQRPTTDERIGFIPPPSSTSRQHQQRRQQ